MKKINKKFLSMFLALATLLATIPLIGFASHEDDTDSISEDNEIFLSMLARAEAFVNYEWIPTQDIAVWNENPYNGKMYFPAGETVKGVPYTLFFNEIGVDSLLSLEEFKNKVDRNYSTTAYCTSVKDMRTGPVYGSCCATFVSEVFGGDFVSGISPRYDSVSKIINSGHCETYYKVKATDIEPGDAISNVSGSHIVWVGEVTDTYITIYEETPPVAQKVTLYFDTNVGSDGYLHYGNSDNENSNIYNVITKSHDLLPSPYEIDEMYSKYCPFKAEPCVTENFEVFKPDLVTHGGEIYVGDYCTIYEVYENGWCKVNFPLDSGGTITAYTLLSNFIDNSQEKISSFTSNEYIDLFPTKVMDTRIFRIYPNDICDYFGTAGSCTQLFMPHVDGYYVLGWADISQYATNMPVATTLSVKTLPLKTTYITGEELYTSGLELLLTYSDGSTETISDGFTVSGFNSDTAGEKTISVSYKGLLATFNITVTANEDETGNILYGDLNSDGKVNKKDSLLMKMYLADNSTTIDLSAADVYCDGIINKKDSLYLKQYLAGLDVELGK